MAKRCTLTAVGPYDVPSDSSSKVYEVTIRADGKNTCTCVGFVTKRNKLGGLIALGQPDCTCKHIRQVLSTHSCNWNSETGKAQKYPTICPVCDSTVEEYDPPLPAKLDDDLLNEAMAGLLSLRERMAR